MRLSPDRVKKLCKVKGLRLGELLEQAGVSRTAYYHLVRKRSVLPRSVLALAETLGVPPSRLLEKGDPATRRVRELLGTIAAVLAVHPDADRDTVWHTLVLLEEAPVDRLNRGLLRGQATAVH